ncbi:response regulator [Sphingomonas sp. PB2P12]|uniref:response regulator n=1 Tax=Sphingomonas sandaracina TaxID=3096157 RepID=UPI002FC64C0E
MLFGKKKRNIVRLLLVEDEPLIAFDNEHFLTDAAYTVVATVDRVADALAIIANSIGEDGNTDIDLVLVDVHLADGSGLDVARAAQARGVPVMFVTGNFPDEATTLAAGCLSKPYAPRDLIGAIAVIDARIGGTVPKRLPPGFRLFETLA